MSFCRANRLPWVHCPQLSSKCHTTAASFVIVWFFEHEDDMTNPNPLHLANTAQQMARTAPAESAAVFNKVAMVCMGVMAAASVLQVLQPLLRDLTGKGSHSDRHGRGR